MSSWTLKYSTTEQTLAAWGLAQPVLEFFSQAADTLTLTAPGYPIDSDPIFPYGAAITLYRNRTGSGTSWSGGTQAFQGTRDLSPARGNPREENRIYQFKGPWWQLENTVFQQTTTINSTSTPSSTSTVLTSDLFLLQSITGAKYTVGQQLTEIITYANTAGINLVAGSELPSTSLSHTAALADTGGTPTADAPIYQIKDMTCAEAIKQILRWAPDAVTWFDYTTSTPTFHCKARANLSGVSLAIANGTDHEALDITTREDLQVPLVCLRYKILNEINGQAFLNIVTDKYPTSGVAETIPFGLVQTIDLQGGKVTTTQADITTAAISAPGDSQATKLAYWKKFHPALSDPHIDPGSIIISDPTFKDASDATITPLGTYPNYLQPGPALAAWMYNPDGSAVIQQAVKMLATVQYKRYAKLTGGAADTTSQKVEDLTGSGSGASPGKQLQVNLTATNAQTRTYKATVSETSGDPVPIGLAQYIHGTLSTIQYEGSHTLVEAEVTFQAGPGKVLNLTGGRTAWATMNALIQSATYELETGRTILNFGPPGHLSPGDFIRLLSMNRYRFTWQNPALRTTALPTNGGQVDQGNAGHKENSSADIPTHSQVAQVDPASTAAINHDPHLIVTLAGSSLAAGHQTMQPRKLQACVAGNLVNVILHATETYS